MRFFRLMAIAVLLLACVLLGAACAGAKGEQGPKGDTGEQGIQGIQGVQGAPGPNMIVAMGFINYGTIMQGYNITSCSWNDTYKQYEIVLTGIDYYLGDYVTVVTPDRAYFAFCQSASPKLLVKLQDSAGNPQTGSFSFIVLECP